jgi:hypothetical protein
MGFEKRSIDHKGYDPWMKYEADYFQGSKKAYLAEKERMADILIRQVEKVMLPGRLPPQRAAVFRRDHAGVAG